MARLDTGLAAPGLDPALRDEVAEELWQIALMVEEGDLATARDRLRRAQDRLDEASRNGASPEEIQELMGIFRVLGCLWNRHHVKPHRRTLLRNAVADVDAIFSFGSARLGRECDRRALAGRFCCLDYTTSGEIRQRRLKISSGLCGCGGCVDGALINNLPGFGIEHERFAGVCDAKHLAH